MPGTPPFSSSPLDTDGGKDNPRPRHFSEDLEVILRDFKEEHITFAQLEQLLHGRGFAAICLILCLPFIQPIPLPGLSVIFGLTICAIGLRLACGDKGALPAFIQRRQMETQLLKKIAQGAKKAFSYIERFLCFRLEFMFHKPFLNWIGVSIVISGVALSLPIPPVVLFSNSIPAWAIIFLCLGYIEKDGLFTLIGHIIAIAAWVYFAFWWEVVSLAIKTFMPA